MIHQCAIHLMCMAYHLRGRDTVADTARGGLPRPTGCSCRVQPGVVGTLGQRGTRLGCSRLPDRGRRGCGDGSPGASGHCEIFTQSILAETGKQALNMKGQNTLPGEPGIKLSVICVRAMSFVRLECALFLRLSGNYCRSQMQH
jgi:hypothetical protein